MLFILIANSMRLLHDHMGEQAQRQAEQIAPILNAALLAPLAQSDYATVQAVLDESHATKGLLYLAVEDAKHHLVAISGWDRDKTLPPADNVFTLDTKEPHPSYNVARNISLSGQVLGTLHFGLDLTEIVAARHSLLSQGMAIALSELLFSTALLTLLGFLLTRELAVITRASQRVAEGELTPSPVPEGKDDVGRLGAAFNAMSRAIQERLGQLTEARNQMALLAETTRQEHDRLNTLLSAMSFGVLFTDQNQKILYVNQALIDLWHLPLEQAELLGQDQRVLENHFKQKLSGDSPQQHPLTLATGKGEVWLTDAHILAIQHLPLGKQPHAATGHLWLFMDVTPDRLAAQELINAKESAEAASLAKAAFLATMSHEIRTPMNGILGMAELMSQTPLNAEQTDFLKLIRSSADNLLTIVNDILDFSKIEAGRMALEKIDFDLKKLIDEASGIMQPTASKKGLTLVTDIDNQIPSDLLGDPVRLRQILLNLLSNAIKFTPAGQITLKASLISLKNQQIQISFAVMDQGIGIAPEKLANIFDPFTQADDSITRKYGGTGLGLAIVSRLVNLMDGKISVRSEPGQGSTFEFSAYFAIRSEPVETVVSLCKTEWRLHPLNLLLADDNLVNQKVALGLLKKLGHQVTAVWNGQEAIDTLTQFSGPFDAILMDMQMPVLNGLEATRLIRQISGPLAHIPIIALTANASENDKQECLAAGMNGFITKPFHIDEITQTLARTLPHKTDRFLPP